LLTGIATHDIISVASAAPTVITVTSYSIPDDANKAAKTTSRVKQLTHLTFASAANTKLWISKISETCNLLVDPTQPQLKRRFLIFINPVSGTRKAREQWKSVQSLLDAASCVAYTAIGMFLTW